MRTPTTLTTTLLPVSDKTPPPLQRSGPTNNASPFPRGIPTGHDHDRARRPRKKYAPCGSFHLSFFFSSYLAETSPPPPAPPFARSYRHVDAIVRRFVRLMFANTAEGYGKAEVLSACAPTLGSFSIQRFDNSDSDQPTLLRKHPIVIGYRYQVSLSEVPERCTQTPARHVR